MDIKDMCVAMATAESEEEIIGILKLEGYWEAQDCWQNFGDNENNYSVIGSQQSAPDAALVEKITNSVDAVLISECLSRGIAPESDKAPKSIPEALQTFFSIPAGKLSNLTVKERNILAERICLVATGKKSAPCYAIYDSGEGQTPISLRNTILSLTKSNKLRIPFVQGKFNMGGTGVFRFCGKRNLQLIISKRNPKILTKDGGSEYWGFTIVRREDPKGGVRSSVFRYLAPKGEILRFKSDSLNLLPGEYPNAYERPVNYGTYIKMYDYDMPGGLKTNILFDLYNRLSLLIPTVAMPVRLYERRKGYGGHTFETTLSGLTVRLDEDKRKNLEDGFPTSTTFTAMDQPMRASIFAFKKDKEEKYSEDEGIIFTQNGQTHGTIPNIFFHRKSVGMGYLADSLLITVDCSEISGRAREDLFMNSRDRLCICALESAVKEKLEEIVRTHPGLRELREKRRREEIEGKLKDSRPLLEVLQEVMKKSPTLAKLFMHGGKLTNPFNTKKTGAAPTYAGKKFPTFFKLINGFSVASPKPCPINCRFRVQYSTDAVNDYFNRDNDPGSFSITVVGVEVKDSLLNLWNGTANLTVKLPDGAKVGDIITFKTSIFDMSRVDPFEETFVVKVVNPEVNNGKHPVGKRKPPAADQNGNKSEKNSSLAMPQVTEVRRDEWEHHKFDRESALKAVSVGDGGYDFFVNMDNIHLLTEAKGTKEDARLLEARYKFGMTLIGLAILRVDNDSPKKQEGQKNGEDATKVVYDTTKALSPILLPMIASLGDLEIDGENPKGA